MTRRKCGLVNDPILDSANMVSGLRYFWYKNKNGISVYQGYYIEEDAKKISHAKRIIRKMIESNPDFSHWV